MQRWWVDILVFPAIDLLGGQVVRLFQGEYEKSEAYGDDPASFAAHFGQAGARCLHVVDLDGARTGRPVHLPVVRRLCQETGLFVELGGGIRSEETVEHCFEAGIGRVILGTAALKDEAFTRRMLGRYGPKIAIGVDARNGRVATEGWLETSDTDSYAFCQCMAELGVQHIIYTDIARDGAQQGANLPVFQRLTAIKGLEITASGGVSSLEDVRALKRLGCAAVIVGKALYTGALQLCEVLAAAREPGDA